MADETNTTTPADAINKIAEAVGSVWDLVADTLRQKAAELPAVAAKLAEGLTGLVDDTRKDFDISNTPNPGDNTTND